MKHCRYACRFSPTVLTANPPPLRFRKEHVRERQGPDNTVREDVIGTSTSDAHLGDVRDDDLASGNTMAFCLFRHGRVDVEEVHVGISSYAPRLGVHEPGAATGLDDERTAAGDRANPLHVKSRRRPIERKLLDDVVDRLVQALP